MERKGLTLIVPRIPSGIHIQIRFRTGHISLDSLTDSRSYPARVQGAGSDVHRSNSIHSKRANLLTSIRQTPPSKMSASIDLDVERQGSTAPAAILAQPAYLRPLADHHVLLCTVCGSCYVRKTYERHLREVHRLLGEHKARVLAWLATEPVAETEADVLLPPNGQLFVKGLAVHDGWTCNVGSCIFLTGSRDRIRQHCSKEHLINIKTDAGAASPVKLQTLFVKNPKYFTVVVTPDCPPRPTGAEALRSPHLTVSGTDSDQAQFSQLSQYNQVQTPQHVSEITPWLTRTGFHIHLAGRPEGRPGVVLPSPPGRRGPASGPDLSKRRPPSPRRDGPARRPQSRDPTSPHRPARAEQLPGPRHAASSAGSPARRGVPHGLQPNLAESRLLLLPGRERPFRGPPDVLRHRGSAAHRGGPARRGDGTNTRQGSIVAFPFRLRERPGRDLGRRSSATECGPSPTASTSTRTARTAARMHR